MVRPNVGMKHISSLLSAALLGLPSCGVDEMPRRVDDYAEADPAPPASFDDATVKHAVRTRAELDNARTVQSVSCGTRNGPWFLCNVDFGGACATYRARVGRDGTVLVTPPPGASLCITVTDESGPSD
jgi:hypothetical protein